MSLTPEPNKGLRLKLGRLAPIPTWHGGGNFWSHEFQLIVRSGALATFLPRAIEDEDSVLYEYRSGGSELASTSTAIGSMAEIPAKELNALRDAVEELKRKAEDPHCDRTKRRMIESFRLPDPQRDRDLYRLIGKGSSAKLIVLWGIEREEGSSLSPGAAVDLMHTPASGADDASPVRKKSMALPVLLVLALLLGGGGWYYWQDQEKKRIAAEEAAALAAQEAEAARIAAFNAAATGGATNPGTPVPPATTEIPVAEALPEGTVIQEDDGTVAGVVDKDGTLIPADPGTGVDKEGKTTAPAKPGEVVKDEKNQVKGVVAEDGKVVAATPGKTVVAEPGKPVSAPPGTAVRDSKGTLTGVVGTDGKVVAAKVGTVIDPKGTVTASKPGTVFRDEKGSVTGVTRSDGAVVATKPGTVASKGTYTSTRTAPKFGDSGFGTPFTGLGKARKLGDYSDTGAEGTSSGGFGSPFTGLGKARKFGAGTVVRDKNGSVAGLVDKDGNVVSAAPGTVLDKDGRATTGTAGTVLRDRNGVVTGVYGKDGRVVATTPGKIIDDPDGKLVTGVPGTVVRNGSGVVTGVYGGDGRLVASAPGTVIDPAGKVVTSRPGTVFRDSTGVVNGIAGADGKVVEATPGAIGDDPFAAVPGAPVAAATPAVAPTPAAATPVAAATPAVAPTPAAATPVAAPTPPATTTTQMTTQGAPPAGISSLSIVSTSLSPVLANGNVEVLFNVVARNDAGVVVNAPPITGWKVNDQLQSKPDGSPADGPVIPMSLPPGTHRISTVGTGADGKPFQTDADVVVTPKP